MLQVVLAALKAADWPRALELALAAWRESRAPELANLIDWIGSRIAYEKPAEPETQAQWLARAWRRAPAELGSLIASIRGWTPYETADERRERWQRRPSNPIAATLVATAWFPSEHERIAALLEWPDDPRLATALVGCVLAPINAHLKRAYTVYSAIGDRIAAIGDIRTIPVLERCAVEPRGKNDADRDLQSRIAKRVLEKLATRQPPGDPGPLFAECAALVAPPPAPPPIVHTAQIDALWREVAAHPDDIAARGVLGDALVELGDPRGELIVMSCNTRTPGRPLRGARDALHDGRVKTLVRRMWDEWLGDLALVLSRRGSELRCGMLETIAVGQHTTPPWAWPKLAGHRELACVHTVRPGWVTPAHYAELVAILPRDPQRLAVDSPAAIDALAAVRAGRATGALELRRNPTTYSRGTEPPSLWSTTAKPLLATCERAAKLAPDVTEISLDIDVPAWPELQSVLITLRTLFPQLAKIVVSERMASVPNIRELVAALPLVEIVAIGRPKKLRAC